MFFLGTIIGTAASSVTLMHLGAKKVCLISAPAIVVSWILFYFATGLEMAIAARILSGLCYGSILSSGNLLKEDFHQVNNI
jgi:predicted MFS family arabinose efflux permease